MTLYNSHFSFLGSSKQSQQLSSASVVPASPEKVETSKKLFSPAKRNRAESEQGPSQVKPVASSAKRGRGGGKSAIGRSVSRSVESLPVPDFEVVESAVPN